MDLCRKCASLERKGPASTCPACKGCREHRQCKCVKCGRCGNIVPKDSVCGGCHACKDHHTSLHIPPQRSFPHRACSYVKTGRPTPTYDINPLHNGLGVELELAEWASFQERLPAIQIKPTKLGGGVRSLVYQITRDGSVHPSERELVVNPLWGDDVPELLPLLVDKLVEHGSTVNQTCGLHVHIDAANFTYSSLRRILYGWMAVQEQVFERLVSPHRSAMPAYQFAAMNEVTTSIDTPLRAATNSSDIKTWLVRYLYGIDRPLKLQYRTTAEYQSALQRFKHQISQQAASKYVNHARRSALNLHSWMMRGTVEFRLKEATLDPYDVVNWTLWCGWLVNHLAGLEDEVVLREWHAKRPLLLDVVGQLCSAGMPSTIADWVSHRYANPLKPSAPWGVEGEQRRNPTPRGGDLFNTPQPLTYTGGLNIWGEAPGIQEQPPPPPYLGTITGVPITVAPRRPTVHGEFTRLQEILREDRQRRAAQNRAQAVLNQARTTTTTIGQGQYQPNLWIQDRPDQEPNF